MTKRQHNKYTERTVLTKAGWELKKASRYNSGSETVRHATCKVLVGHYLTHQLGYQVAFEVEGPQGELDVLAYGLDDRISPIGVECETGLSEAKKQSKLERYYFGSPLKELHFIEVDDMPENIMEAYEWIAGEL